jgi:NADH-quinone oxidoreductase subunit N
MPDQILAPAIDYSVILQILLVFGWAMALLVVGLFIPRNRSRIVGYLALLGIGGAAIVGVPLWNSSATTFSGMLTLDNYSLALNWIFLLTAAITITISLDYLSRQGIERTEYYTLILFATGGMMLLAQGTDLIILFLGLETLSITLYVLAGFAYPRVSSEEAAIKYLLVGAFGAGFLVFGLALLYGATGTSNLAEIGTKLAQGLPGEDLTLALIGTALVIVGFGYKISMAPFHMWTPDVYEGSPTPVAAFMAVGSKAAGFAALTRFLAIALSSHYQTWSTILAVLAAITMLVGNITALSQNNVKRMLAYSSIGHAGYILMGVLAAGSPDQAVSARGVQGLLFYLLAYALTNLCAFAVLIALEQRGESAWDLSDFAGLWRRQLDQGQWPLLSLAMSICMFSLAGIPPTIGFWGKFYVFTAAWQAGLQWLAIVAVISSAIAAFFYLRIVVQMHMRDSVRDVQPASDRGLVIGITLAALGVILLGIIPTPLIELVQQSVLALGR